MDECQHTYGPYVDEGMVLLERCIERGDLRLPSAEERRSFDQEVRRLLDDLTRCANEQAQDKQGDS